MTKPIIAITGHTSGIGQAIHNFLREMSYEVRGFSRSTGHDLSEPSTITRLVEETSDCGVFINNAFYDWAQTDLLFALFENWKSQDKLILNVGSDFSEGQSCFSPYATKKAALDHATEQLSHDTGSKCRICTIKAGWVRTPQIEHLKISEPKLEPMDVAKMVEYVLNLPRHIHISTLTVQARSV